ncbi:dipeptide/oligopeptide/nickel ABC transporter ATP-binding protein [Candidatus Nitrosopelagicus brevis]|uniref:Dipeptide/oligopeptide/nickel ABC transporter ATP-binding protein n=1 Tax=Candidatus Nitrosopelagicus brevis TaxID=1410606 RepID=A0A0A7V241_9ARCH|nr:ABC transporter ATP-binding protein [Candidatus Nitrosopelagicus brevis]AJA93092.1 oligopeptide/dipeptide transporter, C-terminal domain protein [Candidatus Nitrosopelagicus brevis]PTL88118.1 dipeptide/oligopeptide/nickel ABC transporter ATP-binding protein [Candidatus Nitrosopelagicus brevis]|tara:strand:- start:709 stop:1644 length:936 start_codon:yes stop_codon:yes gene_type:complete
MSFISIENLTTRYNTSKGLVHALEDVTFAIDKGESIGIAGESACGKSTLGLSIIQMISNGKIYSGKIQFDGQSLLDIPDDEFDKKIRWKEISMVFQGAMSSLDPVFSIQEQFDEVLKQHNFEGDSKQSIIQSLNSVNLDESVLKKFPHELSGGMKQRVIIAMALILKPKFVIADEPTTALDVLIQAQIVNLFKKLKKDGQSFMIISHDLAVLSEVAEKIGIMYGGRMVEFGDSEEIFLEPKHPYTKGLLESIPVLSKDTKPKFIPGIPPNLVNPSEGCKFYDRCPEAMEKCKKDPPKIKTKTGYVSCWLYE